MKGSVTWVGKRNFTGRSGSGHEMPMSASAAEESEGASPMEMVLLGLGGCSSYDVVNILEKMREPITDCLCEIEAERAEEAPRVFTTIHMKFIVTGRGLNPDKVNKAVTMSAEKYCSASIMLGKTAKITHSIDVREAEV